jgi:hypothetical protein
VFLTRICALLGQRLEDCMCEPGYFGDFSPDAISQQDFDEKLRPYMMCNINLNIIMIALI